MNEPGPVVKHVQEYGWAAFDRKTGAKLEGDEFGPWWVNRKAVLAHLTDEPAQATSGLSRRFELRSDDEENDGDE